MPSGYTSDIADGKDISFTDFALNCAKAFGACIEQRDDNYKPKLFDKDSYHLKEIEELKKWKKPTKEEYNDYVTKQAAYYNEQIDKRNKLKIRYQQMLDKANAWNPPTKGHTGLKQFMIDQLSESLKNDCKPDYYESELSKIESYTYEDVVSDMRDSNKRDIEYHTEQLKKDNKRVEGCNEWISALYKSLEN